jgi:hypothetical protein
VQTQAGLDQKNASLKAQNLDLILVRFRMINGADKFEVYAEFGLAAEKGQMLEVEAGNFCLAYIALFFKPNQITDEQREMLRSVVNDLNRKS